MPSPEPEVGRAFDQPEPPSPSGRLVAIDALRGVAVLAVLISHLPFSTALSPGAAVEGGLSEGAERWFRFASVYGATGVDLFLVISGFCIHLSWAKRRDDQATIAFFGFWKRRLMRLYPPYAVALACSLGGLFVLYGVLGRVAGAGLAARFGYPSLSVLAVDLVALVLLIQNFSSASLRIGNGVFWSLALEEQLYLLYFPLLAIRKRLGWGGAFAIVIAVTVGWRAIGATFFPGYLEWIDLGPARWLEWTLGALAVEAHLGRVTLPAWCRSFVVAVVVLGLAVVATQAQWFGRFARYSELAFAFGYFFLCNAACAAEATLRRSRIGLGLAFLGTFSYSLYLVQVPLIVVAKQIGLRVGLSGWAIIGLRAAVAIVGAYVFFRLFERPFLKRAAMVGERGAPTERATLDRRR